MQENPQRDKRLHLFCFYSYPFTNPLVPLPLFTPPLTGGGLKGVKGLLVEQPSVVWRVCFAKKPLNPKGFALQREQPRNLVVKTP